MFHVIYSSLTEAEEEFVKRISMLFGARLFRFIIFRCWRFSNVKAHARDNQTETNKEIKNEDGESKCDNIAESV